MAEAADRIRIRVEAAVCAGPELAALAAGAWTFAPGGAAVGHVVDAGEGAAHLAGRRVVVGPVDACGECERCRRGVPFACPDGALLGHGAPGALAGEIVVRARWVTELGNGLEIDGPLAALIAREAADAYALCARAGLAAGEPAVVLGRGPVARLLLQIARARGARAVAASAAADGADAALETVRAHIAEHAGGGRPVKIFAVPEGEADAVELELAVDLAGPGALVAVLSRPIGSDGRTPDMTALLAGGGAVVGVPAAHPDLVPEVAALAVRGEIDLAAIGEVYRPEPGQPLLAHPAALAERARAALAAGRALIVDQVANREFARDQLAK
ncbi:MAG TPA: alcohol dehydrogenase catalytic domain-containing protein [Kofleriaceae bacterium]|nr:alcohol dehydrogenase catalytic domain-containing protein [Kofleriaceae bacterium]